MRKVKRWMIILIAIIIVAINIIGFTLVDLKKDVPQKIVLIPKSISPDFEFWQTVKQGAELAAKEENVQLVVKGAQLEKDIQEQHRLLEETIAERPDIIILAASDTEALVDLIEKAKEEGIILLTVDSKAEGIEGVTHVATDNVEAAQALTLYMADSINKQGEVIMVNFVLGTSTAIEREQGYRNEIEKYPNITMHPTVYSEGTVEGAYQVTKKVLAQYPHLKAIIGANQQTTDGICDAVRELGLDGKIKVVGFDSSNTIIYALEKNVIDAIIVQKPFNMGYLAVKNSIEAYRGKAMTDYINTGYKFINKETLYLIENQKLLYPIIK